MRPYKVSLEFSNIEISDIRLGEVVNQTSIIDWLEKSFGAGVKLQKENGVVLFLSKTWMYWRTVQPWAYANTIPLYDVKVTFAFKHKWQKTAFMLRWGHLPIVPS